MKTIRPWIARGCAISLVALVCAGITLEANVSATSTLPDPVTNVTAVASTTSTDITVSWNLPTTGVTPDRVLVTAFTPTTTKTDLGLKTTTTETQVGQVTCAYPICSSIDIPGLAPGVTYTFSVQAGVASGDSTAVTSNAVTPNWGCATAQVCVNVNGTTPGAAAEHRAAGMVDGVNGVVPESLVAPLDIKYWELDAGDPNCSGTNCIAFAEYDDVEAVDPTAELSEVLSDNWRAYTDVTNRECPMHESSLCGFDKDPTPYSGAQTPWSNWSEFDSFTSGVVRDLLAVNANISWWNLINEPPAYSGRNDAYFDGEDSDALTATDLEQWFLHAYDDVKSVDPSANIVCPSFEQYDDFPGEAPTYNQILDFSTFLQFAAANGIDCNAFSWHEINSQGSLTDFNMQPQTLQDHVARFRALLQQYPQFAGAQIWINEYVGAVPTQGGAYYETLPGWNIGFIASIEAAGVDESNHTCIEPSGCGEQLDDLLLANSGDTAVTPTDTYWPYWYYAQMNGNIVPVTSTQQQVSGFATVNSSTNSLMVLLGRHDVGGADPLPANETTTMTVDVPWAVSNVNVATQSYPDAGGTVTEPPITTTTVPVVDGVATISIPSFGAQCGYGITITPSSSTTTSSSSADSSAGTVTPTTSGSSSTSASGTASGAASPAAATQTENPITSLLSKL